MIRMFLKELPSELRYRMNLEYQYQSRELSYLWENNRWLFESIDSPEPLQFLIALAIYYRYIIAPIGGCSNFIDRLGHNDSPKILKFGSTTITSEIGEKYQEVIHSFEVLLAKFEIRVYELHFDSVRTLIEQVKRKARMNHGEEESL